MYQHLCRKWKQEGQRFVEVHVIFDRYIEESLKSGTRTEGAGAETVRYKICDSTVIELLTTNQFLSDIKTKQYLTMYLSMKLCEIAFQNVWNQYEIVFQNVAFAVSYEFTFISNTFVINARLKDHCYKKADTFCVLHSLHVTKCNSFTDLVVYYCDADVLMLLLCYIDESCVFGH